MHLVKWLIFYYIVMFSFSFAEFYSTWFFCLCSSTYFALYFFHRSCFVILLFSLPYFLYCLLFFNFFLLFLRWIEVIYFEVKYLLLRIVSRNKTHLIKLQIKTLTLPPPPPHNPCFIYMKRTVSDKQHKSTILINTNFVVLNVIEFF